MSETPTTETEAVNIILGWNGDNPVNDIGDTANLSLTKAVNVLTECSRRLQAEGWSFNTDYDFPLSLNGNNEIELPANALFVDPSSKAGNVDFVERGRKLWDRKNHTFTHTSGTYVDIVFFLPFADLPEHARNFVTMLAASTFFSRELADPEVKRMLAQELQAARIHFNRIEAKVTDPNLKKSAYMADIVSPHTFHPTGRRSLKI